MNVYYRIAVLSIVVCPFSCFSLNAQEPVRSNGSSHATKVGTFDSRVVALAYYRSKPFKEELAHLFAEHKKAKERGDLEQSVALEKRGPELQELMHWQGFGTWPVDNILEKIKGQLPDVAKKAGVDLIVSKWDLAYTKNNLNSIDVTDLLIEPFKPDEATRKVIREIQSKPPIPVEQLNVHK